jgi:tetratricopeptide (TPR) repeat protein
METGFKMTHAFLSILICGAAFFLNGAWCQEVSQVGKQTPASGPDPLDQEVTVLIGGEPFAGKILPPVDRESFRFKLTETGDVMDFRWSALEPAEAKRLQKLAGLEVRETGQVVFGEEIPCALFMLKNGKALWGLELPGRAISGYRCLKTATTVIQVPEHEIQDIRTVYKRESELFGAQEVYDRLLAEKPPTEDAGQHLTFARTCFQIGLYDKALDHLDLAQVLDSKVAEMYADFRIEAVAQHAEKMAQRAFHAVMRAKNREEYITALDLAQRLREQFPNTAWARKLESYIPELDEKATQYFKRRVVYLYHWYFQELILEKIAERVRVDRDGNPVPAKPGKQVSTKAGHLLKGALVSLSQDEIVLDTGQTQVRVPMEEVASIRDVNLAPYHKTVAPTFSQLRDYVTDTSRLGTDIVRRIAEQLKVEEQRVQDAWNSRFDLYAEYRNGQLHKEPAYATTHEANYGSGSWLRPGVKLNGQGGKHPALSNDPDVWWTIQPYTNRTMILRALAAEAHFEVQATYGRTCPECGGEGRLRLYGVAGGVQYILCPTCRGGKKLIYFFYK